MQGGNRDRFGFQFCKRRAQANKVGRIGQNGKIRVAAKFRGAVEHARLPAHEERADAVRLHRRKDFAYRVRDQVHLPVPHR